MGKKYEDTTGGPGASARGQHRASGWSNPRDREDDGPTHDATRLTDHERYGVSSNVPIPGREG